MRPARGLKWYFLHPIFWLLSIAIRRYMRAEGSIFLPRQFEDIKAFASFSINYVKTNVDEIGGAQYDIPIIVLLSMTFSRRFEPAPQ